MKININKNRGLELDIDEVSNDENKEYYVLVKVQPTGQEIKTDGDVIQKVAIDDGLARLIPNEIMNDILTIRSVYYQRKNENTVI